MVYPNLSNHTNWIDFYVTGGTLQIDARCYITRQADDDLYVGLTRRNFCYVLTSRQIGKSSLIVRTAMRLREGGSAVAVLDLTAIGQNLTVEQWYDGLLVQMGQELSLADELEAYWLDHKRQSPLQRWMHAIREVVLTRLSTPVIIFIDEIDFVRSLPFSTDEFFSAIRALHNSRTIEASLNRLTFCLSGVVSPGDLIRDTHTTPFNLGQRVELTDFTREEAVVFAQGLGRGVDIASSLLDRVFYWTNGHPYLTQQLCKEVASDKNVNDSGGVDWKCNELFFSVRAKERESNLIFVQDRLLRGETDRTGLLDLYLKVRRGKRVLDDETNPLMTSLRLSGVTCVDRNRLKIRNRIYQQVFDQAWVKANLPDAELRRQRRAYYRGLLRAGGVAAIIILLLATLVVIAVNERNRALAQTDLNSRLLYNAQMKLAEQALDDVDFQGLRAILKAQIPQPGQEDLRSFEWYYYWKRAFGEIQTYYVHDGIQAYAFLPNNHLVVVVIDNKELTAVNNDEPGIHPIVAVVDLLTGRKVIIKSDTKYLPSTIVLSPNGQLLATSNLSSGTIEIWDTTNGTRQSVVEARIIGSISFSPSGKFLKSVTTDSPMYTVRIWNAKTGALLFSQKKMVSDIENTSWIFSADSSVILTKNRKNSFELVDALTGNIQPLTIHSASPLAVALARDGNSYAVQESNDKIRVIDRKTGIEKLALMQTRSKEIIAPRPWLTFLPDGKKLLARNNNQSLTLWDLTTGTRRDLPIADPQLVVFSSDSKFIAAPDYDPQMRGAATVIKIWDTSATDDAPMIRTDTTRTLAFSIKASVVVRLTGTGMVTFFDLASGLSIGQIDPHMNHISQVELSQDGKFIGVVSLEGQLKVWRVQGMTEETEMESYFKNSPKSPQIRAFGFSPDGRLIAAVESDGSLFLIDLRSGTKKIIPGDYTRSLSSSAFSQNGELLAIASGDQEIVALDTSTGNIRKTIKTLSYKQVFSPDGSMLACRTAETIELWETSGTRDAITAKASPVAGFTGMTFSPDGRRLVYESKRKDIVVLDVKTGNEVCALSRDFPLALDGILSFSPDASYLLYVDSRAIKRFRTAQQSEFETEHWQIR